MPFLFPRQVFTELIEAVGGTRTGWFGVARAMRLALLQHADGYWDVSDGLALGVLAAPLPPKDNDTALSGGVGAPPAANAAKAAKKAAAAAAHGAEKLLRRVAVLAVGKATELGGELSKGVGGANAAGVALGSAEGDAALLRTVGCPLSGFDAEGIEESVPPELRALERSLLRGCSAGAAGVTSDSPWTIAESPTGPEAEADGCGSGELSAGRVWATCLALASLASLDCAWLADATEGALATSSDAAAAWLAAEADKHPELDEMMDSLLEKAEALTARWQRRRLLAIDRAWAQHNRENPSRAAYEAQRAAGWVSFALLRKHDQAAAVFSPSTDGLLRWQRLMILFTAILSLYTTTIWLYYSRAVTCCREVRELLGCGLADLTAPCRGAAVDCSLLVDQFAEVFPGEIPDDYRCAAFPDDESARDQWLAGIIQVAVAAPVFYVIECVDCAAPLTLHHRVPSVCRSPTLLPIGC